MVQRETLTRAWAPKSRKGCITCKIRHVKCDEAKPACTKCSSTGRKCDGYSPNGILNTSSSFQSLSVFPSADSREQRAFDYFVKYTAPELTGYYSPDVWGQRVPRLSFSESALWHIVVALSSIHEGYAGGIQESRRAAQLASYAFALKHYSLAVKSLKEAITYNPKNLELVLLCCALFVCFDSLRGNYKAAITHLQSGIKIILNQKAAGISRPIDDKIFQTFTTLGTEAGAYMDYYDPDSTKALWGQLSLLNDNFDTSSFASIDDARRTLDLMLIKFMKHHTQTQNDGSISAFEASIKTSIVHDDLRNWSRSFDAMVLRKDPANLSSNALRASVHLKLQHTSLKALVNGIAPEEAAEPDDDPDAIFKTIVTLAGSLINAAGPAKTTGNISSDVGIVGALFTTVARCTDPQLRRQALALLKAVPRRQGMWDAEIVSRIVVEVLEAEESQNPGGQFDLGQMDVKIQQLRMQCTGEKLSQVESKMTVNVDLSGET